jgi:Conjugal transfer protein TrbL
MDITKQRTADNTIATLAHPAHKLLQRRRKAKAQYHDHIGSRRHVPNHLDRRLQRQLSAIAFLFGGSLLLALLVAQTFPRDLHSEALQISGSNVTVTAGATGDSQNATGLQGAIQGSQTEPSPTPTRPTSTDPTTSPSPGVVPDPAGGNGALFDPKQWVIDALSAAFAWVVDGVTSTITNLLQQAFALDILILTPPTDTYQNTVVLDFWRTVVAIADSALAIIVCWAGYNSIVGPAAGVRYHEARQVLPRLTLAALAVNLSLLVTQTMIDLNNALSAIVTTPFDNLANLLTLNIRSGPNAAASLALILLFLAFGVVGLFLVIQMMVRLAMLDVLIVTAPLGLVCWVLPQTHAWAQLWTRAFVSTVFVQFLQVLALGLGGGLLVFFPSDNPFGAVMDLIIGIATLYLTLKIPSFLRSLGGPSAPNPLNDATGVAATALMVVRFAALAGA